MRRPRRSLTGGALPSVSAVLALPVLLVMLATPTGCRSVEPVVPEGPEDPPGTDAVHLVSREHPPERGTDESPRGEETDTREEMTPIRVYPVSAGLRPRPYEISALGEYTRAALDAIGAGTDHVRCDHPVFAEAEHFVHEYLEPMLADGVKLEVTLFALRRAGAYYGRADIVVREALDLPREYSSEAVVRGPTIFSQLSALDAQLASLASFPREAVREATDRVRDDLVQRVQLLGLPYRVQTAVTPESDLRGWVEAVYRSIGVPGSEPDQWRFYLPPHDLARYLAEWLRDDGVRVVVIEEQRMVKVDVDEVSGEEQVER